MPILCNYFITLRCNSSCSFCNIKIDNKSKDAKLADVKRNIDDLKKLGVKVIDFTGGEPLLNKNLHHILKYAKKKKIKTLLTTNGILFQEFSEKIINNIDELSFSIGDLNKLNLANLSNNIKIVNKYKKKVTLNYIVNDYNISSIPKLIRIAKKYKQILHLIPSFNYKNRLYKKTKLLRKYSFYKNVHVNLAYLELIMEKGNNIIKPRCKAIESTITILPNNKIILPCFHKGTKKLTLTNGLAKLFKSQIFLKYKKEQGTFDFCNQCTNSCYFRASFFYKIDKYFFLNLISVISYFIKKHMLK